MESCRKNTIFTNCGLTEDGDIWWEKIGYAPKGKTITDWKGAVRPAPQNDNVTSLPRCHPWALLSFLLLFDNLGITQVHCAHHPFT
jgi:GTP-dependent phosphoenolpyruvate carboxykinase